jgi:hypothetical protein
VKKVLSAVLGAILLTTLFVSPVLANPPWYDGPGGPDDKDLQTTPWAPFHRALATDGLVDITGGDASGFVVFVCQSQEGFDYSVDVKGLAKGTYEVKAIPLVDEPEFDFSGGFPFPVILVTSDDVGHGPYDLGSVTIGGKNEGQVEGVVGLDPGEYIWQIVVVDSGGTTILSTIPSQPANPDWPLGIPGDPVGFEVFP